MTVMIRLARRTQTLRVSNLTQSYRFVHDGIKGKPTSEGHATEKTHKHLNAQSDAVGKVMKEKKEAGIEGGKKQTPEKTTKAPSPVLGMQDERGESYTRSRPY